MCLAVCCLGLGEVLMHPLCNMSNLRVPGRIRWNITHLYKDIEEVYWHRDHCKFRLKQYFNLFEARKFARYLSPLSLWQVETFKLTSMFLKRRKPRVRSCRLVGKIHQTPAALFGNRIVLHNLFFMATLCKHL